MFSSLKALYEEAKAAAATLSLDHLQTSYGVDGVKESLKNLDLTYLTPRVIAMGFPSTPDTRIRSRNDALAVSSVLKESHGSGHVMVWNLSDESYDYSLFDNQVVEVCCEGSPAPPLGLMVKVCSGIETWLAADPSNVAAIRELALIFFLLPRQPPSHLFFFFPSPDCMTGKGRTATTCACALAWMGQYDTPMLALEDVAQKRGGFTYQQLCSPSQLRCVGLLPTPPLPLSSLVSSLHIFPPVLPHLFCFSFYPQVCRVLWFNTGGRSPSPTWVWGSPRPGSSRG